MSVESMMKNQSLNAWCLYVCFKTEENDHRSFCNKKSRLFGLSIFRPSVTDLYPIYLQPQEEGMSLLWPSHSKIPQWRKGSQ